MRRAVLAVLACLALAVPATGGASERHPTQAELEGQIMCPVCGTTLDQSNSPLAARIKAFIARRIAAGDTRGEIKSQLVDDFGPAILAEPTKRGFDLVAWLLPLAGLGVGAVALAALAWRWSRSREPAPAAAAPPALVPELERRLDEELARFEG